MSRRKGFSPIEIIVYVDGPDFILHVSRGKVKDITCLGRKWRWFNETQSGGADAVLHMKKKLRGRQDVTKYELRNKKSGDHDFENLGRHFHWAFRTPETLSQKNLLWVVRCRDPRTLRVLALPNRLSWPKTASWFLSIWASTVHHQLLWTSFAIDSFAPIE